MTGSLQDLIDSTRTTSLVVDAKITGFPSWVLAHSFGDEEPGCTT